MPRHRFSYTEQLTGASKSRAARAEKKAERIEEVKKMFFEQKLSKAEIARFFGVSYETILRDFREIRHQEGTEIL